jgi:hypothetical protein
MKEETGNSVSSFSFRGDDICQPWEMTVCNNKGPCKALESGLEIEEIVHDSET